MLMNLKASKPFAKLHLHNKLEVHTHFGWESKYVLERDSLDGDSLWSSSVETGYEHLFGGMWYGRSTRNDFRELKLNAGVWSGERILCLSFRFYSY